MRKGRSLERIAYHEAGHAVACYLCHVSFKFIEICDPQNMPNSEVSPEIRVKVPWISEKVEGRVKKSTRKDSFSWADGVFMLLAGAAAEAIRYKQPILAMHMSAPEYYQADSFLKGWDDEEQERFKDLSWKDTRNRLKLPGIWSAIKSLAEELMISRKIPYKRAIAIIDGSIKERMESARGVSTE